MTDNCPIDINKVKPVDLIEGEDALDTRLLKEWASKLAISLALKNGASNFWPSEVGGVVAASLVQITPRFEDVDTFSRVIVGNLPPACLGSILLGNGGVGRSS